MNLEHDSWYPHIHEMGVGRQGTDGECSHPPGNFLYHQRLSKFLKYHKSVKKLHSPNG